MEWILQMEYTVLDFIQQNLRSPFGDAVMKLVTRLGDAGMIWILAGVLLLCFRKTRKTGILVLAALVINLIFCNLLLKPLVGRVRPFDANGFTGLLIPPPTDPSFPSGHSSASFAAATAIFCRHKRAGIAAYILAALIAFSRLYLYVHYPTDVLAGVLLGIFSALIARFLLRKAEGWARRGQN